MVDKIGRGAPSPLPQTNPTDNVGTSTPSETRTPVLVPAENSPPTSATEQKGQAAKFSELQLTGMARAAQLSNFKKDAPEKEEAPKYTMFHGDGTPLRALPGIPESNKIEGFTYKRGVTEDSTGEIVEPSNTGESKAWQVANFRMTINGPPTQGSAEVRRSESTDAHKKSEKE
jgi:hypothetical protein